MNSKQRQIAIRYSKGESSKDLSKEFGITVDKVLWCVCRLLDER